MNHDEQIVDAEKKLDEKYIYSVLDSYKSLKMKCPNCGKEHSIQVPVNFNSLNCEDCHSFLDPAFWSEGRVVDHFLMRKLISTCYKHTEFAKKVIEELYSRDYHHAKNEEFGVDKSLLLIHAANALVMSGHHSKLLFWASLFSLIPFVGAFIPIYLTSKRLYNNLEFKEKFFGIESYDPTQISLDSCKKIEKIVKFTENVQPYNLLFFYSQYNPFYQFGENDGAWSFLIDRRKHSDGEITHDEPADLDIDSIYLDIIERVCKMHGDEVSQYRLYVDDVVLVDGWLVNPKNERLFHCSQYGYYPKELVKNEDIADIQSLNGDTIRVFKRITFYNPQRQMSVRSFVRILHQGPFTYVESVGTQLLSLVEKLYDSYQEKMTFDDLEKIYSGPNWWQSIPSIKRKRIGFVLWSMIISLVAALIGRLIDSLLADDFIYGLTGSFISLLSMVVILIIMFNYYGYSPKKEDIYTPQTKGFPFPFNILFLGIAGSANKEKARLKYLKQIKHKQETNEFDFSPQHVSLRYGQSRANIRNYFESVDLRLLRRTQDLVIQEAFLECLENAGIDTSDFREGTAQINNYGIMNSGQISGNVNTESTLSTDSKKRKAKRENKTEV